MSEIEKRLPLLHWAVSTLSAAVMAVLLALLWRLPSICTGDETVAGCFVSEQIFDGGPYVFAAALVFCAALELGRKNAACGLFPTLLLLLTVLVSAAIGSFQEIQVAFFCLSLFGAVAGILAAHHWSRRKV